MSRPYEGKGKRCDHPGCKVWISLTEQPRRFALGLCRTHEAKPDAVQARKRVSFPSVTDALDQARKSRFEHGESGAR
jgi:hypothetical protein